MSSKPEKLYPKEDLRMNDEQFSQLAGYIHIADIIKGQDRERQKVDGELLYRYQHLFLDADHMEEEGYNAHGYRIAITGLALGAMSSPIYQGPVLDYVERYNLLVPEDKKIITEMTGRVNQLRFNIPERDAVYRDYLFNQLRGVKEHIQRQDRERDPTAEALELISSCLVWAALADNPSRTQITDQIGAKFSYRTYQP